MLLNATRFMNLRNILLSQIEYINGTKLNVFSYFISFYKIYVQLRITTMPNICLQAKIVLYYYFLWLRVLCTFEPCSQVTFYHVAMQTITHVLCVSDIMDNVTHCIGNILGILFRYLCHEGTVLYNNYT